MHQGIQHSTAFIHSHLQEPLPLEVLAEVACLSPAQFNRRFKAETGYAPAQYVRLYKLRHGLDLIRESVDHNQLLQVQDLAFTLGFGNYETFSRLFGRCLGIAPADMLALLQRLKQEVDPQAPLVLAGTTEMPALQLLVQDALERKIFPNHQLPELQLRLIEPISSERNSRNIEKRYCLRTLPKIEQQLIDHFSH